MCTETKNTKQRFVLRISASHRYSVTESATSLNIAEFKCLTCHLQPAFTHGLSLYSSKNPGSLEYSCYLRSRGSYQTAVGTYIVIIHTMAWLYIPLIFACYCFHVIYCKMILLQDGRIISWITFWKMISAWIDVIHRSDKKSVRTD